MSALPVEAKVAAVRAALAEAGWPAAKVWGDQGLYESEVTVRIGPASGDGDDPPPHAVWRAFAVVDPADTTCWACWSAGWPEGDDDPGEPCGHPVNPSDAPLPR